MCRPRDLRAPPRRKARIAPLLALTLLPAAASAARATDDPPKDPWHLYVFRFEFDNDNFLGSDDAFSAGWSLQLHSRLDDTWHPGYAKWIGRVPGLGDDGPGGRTVRWAAGVGQMIITPRDISVEAPQPDDAPWAGVLSASVSWSAYDNKRMGALQFLLGCMGPCSGAESVQKFIHEDLGFGEPPQGWDNQLVDQALANVNYESRDKVIADEPDQYLVPGRFATDLSVGGQVGLGNLATFLWGQVEYRLGWGLPMGFTKAPDPLGIGIMLDPIYVDRSAPLPQTKAWVTYFTLVGRLATISRLAPADGGETVSGGEHPGVETYPGKYQALLGYHLGRIRFSFHLTYYRYFAQDELDINASNDWINFSFEYRY